MTQRSDHRVVIFANTFTLAGVEGAFPPGIYVLEAMGVRPSVGAEAHRERQLVTIMRRVSDLFGSYQRMEVDASELEAALARDRQAGETKT